MPTETRRVGALNTPMAEGMEAAWHDRNDCLQIKIYNNPQAKRSANCNSQFEIYAQSTEFGA